MDEHTLNELLECSVCLDRLDASSKVLPCQHTFCRRCLEEIVSTKQELRCPECRFLVEIKVEDLPSNILLIRLLEGMKSAGGAAGSYTCTSPSSPRHNSISGNSHIGRIITSKLTSSQPCAKALYNYEAKEPGDLSFKKGDVVLLRKQVDENWFHGELNGQNGFFPATYVQVITALPPQEVPKCTALYDFIIDDENEKDCLTFHKEEVITVIRRIDEHWAEGKLAERIGIFPISFVDLNDSAKWLINNQPFSHALLQQGGISSQLNSPVSSPSAPVTSNSDQTLNNSTAGSSRTNQTLVPQRSENIPPQQQNLVAVSDRNSSYGDVITTVGILVTTASTSGVSTSTIAVMSSPTLAVNSMILALQRPSGGIVNNLSPNGSSVVSSLQQHHNNKRHSFTSIEQPMLSLPVTNQRHSLELPSSQKVVPTTTEVVTTVGQTFERDGTAQSAVNAAGNDTKRPSRSASSGIFIALYNYKPQKEDEVELLKGAYYIVSEKCQDGWYKGTCLRTGMVGVFPGNYVQMVRLPASMKNAPPKRSAIKTPTSATTQGTLSLSNTTAATSGNRSSSASAAAISAIDTARIARSSVNRTHSFPKTSPHLNAEVHGRTNSHGIVKAPSRTITNVTQALSRSTACATPSSTSLLSLSHAQNSSASSHSHQSSHLGNCTLTTQSHTGGIVSGTSNDGLLSLMSTDKSHVCANPGASTHSPKTSRRPHHHHKHSSSSSRGHSSSRSGQSSPASALEASGSSSSSRCSPSVMNVPDSSVGAKSTAQHSKSSNGSKQSQSSAYGAASGGGSERYERHSKEKRERKEHHIKRNESLLKRLASAGIPLKGRKSKSPPPPEVCERKEQKHSSHQRSGSEGSILEGATAIVPSPATSSSQKQKSSDKPGKIKPLARDRYRCVVPYPPQSEIELELKVGDIIYVHKKREDGWLKGTLQRTGKTGLFPAVFVEKF